MATIYKYPLAIVDQQTVRLPFGAQILCAQAQGDSMCLWAMVNPHVGEDQDRDIRVHGTGHPLPDDATSYRYIGTVQLRSGSLVFHVFEAGVR